MTGYVDDYLPLLTGASEPECKHSSADRHVVIYITFLVDLHCCMLLVRRFLLHLACCPFGDSSHVLQTDLCTA